MNQAAFDFFHDNAIYRVKSPLNYVGGKFGMLKILMARHNHVHKNGVLRVEERPALIPTGVRTFVDLFCGGFNVGANADAQNVVGIDHDTDVIDLLSWIRDTKTEDAEATVRAIIATYGLGHGRNDQPTSDGQPTIKVAEDELPPETGIEEAPPQEPEQPKKREGQEGKFYDLRDRYNAARMEGVLELDGFDLRAVLYTLIVHGFNSHIRFGPNGYNIPFGRRTFNEAIARNFDEFSRRLNRINPLFLRGDFWLLRTLGLGVGDFVYCDPPYLITTAPYNESTGWSAEDDARLYETLDALAAKGVRFGVSNVLEHKGRVNDVLLDWAKKYNIVDIDWNYGTASYNLKDEHKGHETREVYVTNVRV